mgnify:CR=1 FL=1
MLIHVVRFIKQQEDIYKLVDEEVKILIREIRHGDCEEFRILYEEDKDSYLDTTKELLQSENISDNTKKGLENFTWDIVKPFLKKVSEKLLIKEGGKSGLWTNPDGLPKFLENIF